MSNNNPSPKAQWIEKQNISKQINPIILNMIIL
jgi:hypothetical protein